jgi:hypothetical protein
MNKQTKEQLIKNLITVAEKYYNEPCKDYDDFIWSSFNNGICYALFKLTGSDYDSYDLMEEVMRELGYEETESTFGDYVYTHEEWEPRAYMCLILAEYLKG